MVNMYYMAGFGFNLVSLLYWFCRSKQDMVIAMTCYANDLWIWHIMNLCLRTLEPLFRGLHRKIIISTLSKKKGILLYKSMLCRNFGALHIIEQNQKYSNMIVIVWKTSHIKKCIFSIITHQIYSQSAAQLKASPIKMITKGVLVGQLQELSCRKGHLKASLTPSSQKGRHV